jgi:iron complex transport system permease protein
MLAAAFVSHWSLVMIIRRPLDVLATGETTAQSLGSTCRAGELSSWCSQACLTAGAVIQGGTHGFIGLVIPHLVRLAFENGAASRGGPGGRRSPAALC